MPSAIARWPRLTVSVTPYPWYYPTRRARIVVGHASRFAETDRLYALWHLLATSGLRRGEALCLRWSDLNTDGKRLSVRRALIAVGYDLLEAEPKTEHGRRTLRLDQGTLAVLRGHRRRQAQERLVAGALWRDEDRTFCRQDGSPLHPDAVSKTFSRLVTASGLRRVRLHDLRHTSATLLLGQGIHPRAVADRLGRADATLVLRVYGHTLADVESRAADAIGALLKPSARRS